MVAEIREEDWERRKWESLGSNSIEAKKRYAKSSCGRLRAGQKWSFWGVRGRRNPRVFVNKWMTKSIVGCRVSMRAIGMREQALRNQFLGDKAVRLAYLPPGTCSKPSVPRGSHRSEQSTKISSRRVPDTTSTPANTDQFDEGVKSVVMHSLSPSPICLLSQVE